MKIVMLGPVYPYKGGIAHYTGMMSKSLAEEHEVVNVSFKLQYPRFLYHREQKDYKNETFKIEGTREWINTVWPFNWLGVARKIAAEKPDMLVIQWWHPFFAPCYWSMLRLLPKKGIKVVFLCHNVLPHEGFPAKELLAKMVLKQGDYFIVHSSQDADDLKRLLKAPQYTRTVHPTYNAFKLRDVPAHEARETLGISPEEEVVLFFGYIREYKGLKHLLAAWPQIKQERQHARLLIVGDFFENNKPEYMALLEQTGCKDSITLVDGYVPDEEVENYFAACDVVALPYESATQSGIVQIAYGFQKPVIATDVGGLPEVVLDGKTGYIVPPKDAQKLASAVIRFFADGSAAQFSENVQAESYKYEWARLNEIIDKI